MIRYQIKIMPTLSKEVIGLSKINIYMQRNKAYLKPIKNQTNIVIT